MIRQRFERISGRIFSYAIDHPLRILTLLLLITALAAAQLPRIRLVTDLKSMLPDDGIKRQNEQIMASFGIKSFIIIGIHNSAGALKPSVLGFAQTLIHRVSTLYGVYQVRSLFSEDNITATRNGALHIAPFISEIDRSSLQSAKNHISSFDAVQGIFVSKDFTTTVLLVECEKGTDKGELYFAIKEILADCTPPENTSVYISGMPVFEGVLGKYMLSDFLRMIPFAAFVVLAMLYCIYRSMIIVGFCAAMICAVDIWTLGLMAVCGVPLYLIQCVMPVILIALSTADEIHLFSRYLDEQKPPSASHREQILTVMHEMARPVMLTSLTTALGFLALTTSAMTPLFYLGLFTAAGILIAMVFALVGTPAVLALWGTKINPHRGSVLLHPFLEATGSFCYRHPRGVCAALLAIIILCGYGLSKVYIQDSWIANFKKTSTVYQHDQALNRYLAGTNILYIALDTENPDGIKDPAFLQKTERFLEAAHACKSFSDALSVTAVLKKLNRELTGTAALPASSDAAAQYLILLEGTSYERFWDPAYRKTNLLLFFKKADYRTGTVNFPLIDRLLEQHLPGVTARLGGDVLLSYHWVQLLRTEQIKSFLASLGFIFLTSAAVFRSLRRAVIVILPIVLSVMMNYAVMGFAGIPLRVSVSICSAIIMGIGIDYAIHLLSRYEVLSRRLPAEKAVQQAFTTTGRAILYNAVVVVGGFLTLLLSRMPPNQKLGLICSLGITTSVIASFLVVPLFFRRHKIPRIFTASQQKK